MTLTQDLINKTLELKQIAQQKSQFECRTERPKLFASDSSIENFIRKRIVEKDNTTYFEGEDRYLKTLWDLNKPGMISKSANYIIGKAITQ